MVRRSGASRSRCVRRGGLGAADKTRVDQATKQVEQGAKQIGNGSVGPGVKQTAKGIGNTVVEGAKFKRREHQGVLQEGVRQLAHHPSPCPLP